MQNRVRRAVPTAVAAAVLSVLSWTPVVSGQSTFTWTGAVDNQWDATTPNWSGVSNVWSNVTFPANVAQFSDAGTIQLAPTINLRGIEFLTGHTTLSGGTLNFYNVDALTMPFLFAGQDASATIASTINVPLGRPLDKLGAGTITLTGANTVTGGTTVSVGTLTLGNGGLLLGPNGLPNAQPAGTAATVLSGAILRAETGSSVTGGTGGEAFPSSGPGGTGGTAVVVHGSLLTFTGSTITGGTGGLVENFNSPHGTGGVGVRVSSGGILNNAGTIQGGIGRSTFTVNTVGTPGGIAVVSDSTQTITNSGIITGGAGGNGIFPAGPGAHGILLNAAASIENTGSITGGAGANSTSSFGSGGNGGNGIVITAGGLVDNAGSIAGGIGGTGQQGNGSPGIGVRFTTAAGTLINRTGGSITGGVVMENFANSVTLHNGSTITNGLNIGNSTGSTLTLTGNSGTQNYSAAVSGATTFNGQLIKSGTGTWVLDQAFTHTGGNLITGFGTLAVTSDAALGAASNGVTLDNGVLRTYAAMTIDRTVTLAANQVGFVNTNGNNVTLSGAIAGNGGFIKQGGGTLTLTNLNNAQANTRIDPGTLAISSDAHLGQSGGALFMNGGTLQITQDVSTNRPVVVAGDSTFLTDNRQLILGGDMSGSGGVTFTGRTVADANANVLPSVILTGTGSWAGGTTIRANSPVQAPFIQVGDGGTTGSLPNGPVVFDTSVGSGNLLFNRSDNVTFGETISESGDPSERGSLFQRGTGTLTLTAANTYSGSTQIIRGGLIVNGGSTLDGTSGTGSDSVQVGGFDFDGISYGGTLLGGTGRITGAVRVSNLSSSFGTVSNTIRGDSGTGTGTLTIANQLSIAGGTGTSLTPGAIAVQLATSGGAITDQSDLLLTGTDGILSLTSLNFSDRHIRIDLLNDAGLTAGQNYTITLVTAEGGFRRNFDPTTSYLESDFRLFSGSGEWNFTDVNPLIVGSDLRLSFTVIPEPASLSLLALGGVALLRRVRG